MLSVEIAMPDGSFLSLTMEPSHDDVARKSDENQMEATKDEHPFSSVEKSDSNSSDSTTEASDDSSGGNPIDKQLDGGGTRLDRETKDGQRDDAESEGAPEHVDADSNLTNGLSSPSQQHTYSALKDKESRDDDINNKNTDKSVGSEPGSVKLSEVDSSPSTSRPVHHTSEDKGTRLDGSECSGDSDGSYDLSDSDQNLTKNDSSRSSINDSSRKWGMIRRSLVSRSSSKLDLWDSVRLALGELGQQEQGVYTFHDFRRHLEKFRISQNPEGSNTDPGDNLVSDPMDPDQTSVDLSNIEVDEGGNDSDFGVIIVPVKPKPLPRRSRNRHRTIDPDPCRVSLRRSGIDSSIASSFVSQPEFIQMLNAEAFKDWARSFHCLDPRWQILTFFNDLALEGVNNLESMEGIIPTENRLQVPLILRAFSRAGVFSVWRPTSNDAIRAMITGEGTGKGLDIKGKSALKGNYSGFVPFLQIHHNDDKAKIGPLLFDSRIRVFYPNQHYRDQAALSLKRIRDSMVQRTQASLHVIRETEEKQAKVLAYSMQKTLKDVSSPSGRPGLAHMKQAIAKSHKMLNDGPMEVDREKYKAALSEKSKNFMKDASIHKIDDYGYDEGIFGLDIPEKLFWEGFVIQKDITREDGSEYETGRPSMPEFQVMNLDTLRKKPKKSCSLSLFPDPRPVLYHAGCGDKGQVKPRDNPDPLCPLGLLMAYEEIDGVSGKVTPVVSDFDCFLLGTRGVEFQEPLGEQEHSMLSICVDEIEGILSTPQKGISWTKRWLEVKKKHLRSGIASEEMSKFGYADPRSYTMMKGAVHRLRGNGAVRHGPECFNYGFPQELDDSYLVISDTLPGQVPWKYVNSAELIDILCEKIDQGFTFPLNPKWILCDNGWKQVYNKLLESSRSNVKESMNIWYPEDVRRRIHEISTQFPRGFVQDDDDDDETIPISIHAQLAEMELKRYSALRSGLRKARRSFQKNSINQGAPTFFATTHMMLGIGREVDSLEKVNQVIESFDHNVHSRGSCEVLENDSFDNIDHSTCVGNSNKELEGGSQHLHMHMNIEKQSFKKRKSGKSKLGKVLKPIGEKWSSFKKGWSSRND